MLVAVASAALYLGPLLARGDVGFPLDDAWIHQTYARNLARLGQWSYEAGRPSTGSTSPLWTLVLAAGYGLGMDYRVWTFGVGLAALLWTAWLARRVIGQLFPGAPPLLGLAVAAFCLLEWHLVWAAFSGMETLLFAALQLLCLERYFAFETDSSAAIHETCSNTRTSLPEAETRGFGLAAWIPAAARGLLTGVCGGLLVLTRPEGIILLGLIGVWFLAARRRTAWTRPTLSWATAAAIGAVAIIGSYAAFNMRTAGFLFPTTFYAKQAEYHAVIEQSGLPARLNSMLLAVLAGGPILLIPGVVAAVVLSLKERAGGVILVWVWWAVDVAMYALRLPVAYQHGRYLIPTLPIFVILGVGGAWSVVKRPSVGAGAAISRVIGRTWLAAAAMVVLLFWMIGAGAFHADVKFINGEMGETAAWLSENVPPSARLAVHDIGMVGYLLDRPFFDLAGLVTPEVIPFISDEHRLIEFMAVNKVQYVVVFPDWSDAYRRMVRDPRLALVHSSGYAWTLAQGRANMTVYRATW